MKRILRTQSTSYDLYHPEESLGSTGYEKFSEDDVMTTPFTLSEIKQLIKTEIFGILSQIKQEIEAKVKTIDTDIKLLKQKCLDVQEMRQRVEKVEFAIDEVKKLQDQIPRGPIISKRCPRGEQSEFEKTASMLSQILFPFSPNIVPKMQKIKIFKLQNSISEGMQKQDNKAAEQEAYIQKTTQLCQIPERSVNKSLVCAVYLDQVSITQKECFQRGKAPICFSP